MKVLIVGAGVAGLAIGWRLAQRGVNVEILERGIAGRGAVWAAAGMIAPGAELGRESDAIVDFARAARAQWPDFAGDLEAASGISICYRETGALLVAETLARATALQAQAVALAQDGVAAAWLHPEQLREREPLLSSTLLGALHLKEDAQVDNRALAEALFAAVGRTAARVREHCEVRALVVQNGEARAVVTADGLIDADRIVLACGAWTNLIGGIAPEILPPVKPVKGQMIACEPPPGTILPRAPVWAEDVYLVPKKTRLLAGATVEDAGFDISVSRKARDFLLGAAIRLIPALCDWRVAEMWAGLRPRSPDDSPVLGPTSVAGLYVASGQFRNGILFAPAVADTLVRHILTEPPRSDHPGAFDPRRFAVS